MNFLKHPVMLPKLHEADELVLDAMKSHGLEFVSDFI